MSARLGLRIIEYSTNIQLVGHRICDRNCNENCIYKVASFDSLIAASYNDS